MAGLLLAALIALASAQSQQDLSESKRKLTNRVIPSYPSLAHTMNLKGIVKLEASVAPNGTVNSIKVVGGHPVLVEAAERAVQKWRWEPASHASQELIELRFNP